MKRKAASKPKSKPKRKSLSPAEAKWRREMRSSLKTPAKTWHRRASEAVYRRKGREGSRSDSAVAGAFHTGIRSAARALDRGDEMGWMLHSDLAAAALRDAGRPESKRRKYHY